MTSPPSPLLSLKWQVAVDRHTSLTCWNVTLRVCSSMEPLCSQWSCRCRAPLQSNTKWISLVLSVTHRHISHQGVFQEYRERGEEMLVCYSACIYWIFQVIYFVILSFSPSETYKQKREKWRRNCSQPPVRWIWIFSLFIRHGFTIAIQSAYLIKIHSRLCWSCATHI